jgi:phosphohistidine swiveling domain-containing protein
MYSSSTERRMKLRCSEAAHWWLRRSVDELYIAPQQRAEPNYVTKGRAGGPLRLLDPQSRASADLEGAVVCIESADPGFDWIFTHGIAGLVTKYGGANSHMAIRCAEFGIPAIIGCGEVLFDQIARAHSVEIDAANRHFVLH